MKIIKPQLYLFKWGKLWSKRFTRIFCIRHWFHNFFPKMYCQTNLYVIIISYVIILVIRMIYLFSVINVISSKTLPEVNSVRILPIFKIAWCNLNMLIHNPKTVSSFYKLNSAAHNVSSRNLSYFTQHGRNQTSLPLQTWTWFFWRPESIQWLFKHWIDEVREISYTTVLLTRMDDLSYLNNLFDVN